MLTKTDENCGGRPCNCAAPCDKNCTSLNKNVSNPPQCQRCTGEYEVFHMPGHPDDGVEFACGIMVENREAGVMVFSCPYFKLIKSSGFLDADTLQAAARVREAEKKIANTPFPNPPVIIAEECIPSPHPWLDSVILHPARQEEKRVLFTKIREAQ